jgi:N-acetylmuramic acid 6-phosphate etherase
MTSFVIGINGGGTHADLIAVSRDRRVLARIEAGPVNYHNIGVDAARETLHTAINDLIAQSGQPASDLIALGAGMAGLDRQEDHDQFEAIFGGLLPGVPLALDNDAIIALIAGAGRPFGVVEICGTGSIGYGINGAGKRVRCGGWGFRLDQGSGHAIGRQVLVAIGRSIDQVIPPTTLTERVLKRLGLANPSDLIGWMYDLNRTIPDISALAAEAVRATETDTPDMAATAILVQAADGLAEDAITIAQKLGFVASGEPFPLVMSGSLFTYSSIIRTQFISAVQAVAPNAIPFTDAHDSAMGAAAMALARIGDPWPETAPLTAPVARRMTERRNALTMHIAQQPTRDLLMLMNVEDRRIAPVIERELDHIAALIDAVAERFQRGGRIIMLGAGTSGRLAVLDAVECRPTFGMTGDQVIGLIAGGDQAITHSIEGAEDDESGGRAALAALEVVEADSVIGIAASGTTPFVIGALKAASERGALTGAIVNVADSPIAALAQHPIPLVIGPEVIMGSTRLRAGTAQKLVLNMLTTGVMVRVGRTFGNLMTDMQASNIKLQGRARVIVSEATGVDNRTAGELLTRSDGEIKTAIAMALLNVSAVEARQHLAALGGNLNQLSISQPSP